MSMQNGKIIDQKAYLKKYLSGDKEKKKKKKDKKHKKSAKVKIIDDDAYEDGGLQMDEDLLLGGEDAPQIVGEYIEDNPEAVRSKWRNIAVKDELKEEQQQDEGESAAAAAAAASAVHIKQEPADEQPEESLWGRKATKKERSPLAIKIKQEKRSSSRDLSPRRGTKREAAAGRSKRSPDQSPQRRKREPEESPPRRRRGSTDQSPPRRRRSPDQSPPRRKREEDLSPPRRKRLNSDQSPPRRRRDTDQSPPRRRRSPNADQSPPRRGRRSPNPDQSPPRRRRAADASPERRRKDADQSPPRRRRNSDQSPPRRRRSGSIKVESPPVRRKSRWAKGSPSPSPPPTHKPKTSSRTLDGKRAGLQDAHSLKQESDERRRREHKLFEQMSSEVSGRDAEIQMRSTGRRGRRAREAAEEDPAEQRRKEEHEKKKKELYDRWGKGLKQIEDLKVRHEEMAHEAAKPVARYANDEDLDRHLREQEHADDPMLEYMRQKRKKQDKLDNKPVMPKYEGSFPENRYGIRPGYRWDGVDRSNGYEQRWFDKQNERKALQDEAYKYSVEDM